MKTHRDKEEEIFCSGSGSGSIFAVLLSVGTIYREPALQSVYGGKIRYEPICYRYGY